MAKTKDGGAIVRISARTAGVVYDGDSLDDWSDDELLPGRRKGKNGKFIIGEPSKPSPELLAGRAHHEAPFDRHDRVALPGWSRDPRNSTCR